MKKIYKTKYIKFIISGGFFTSIDFVIYLILSNFIPINLSKAISIICSTFCSFFINKNWVFRKHNLNSRPTIFRFSFVFFVNIFINVSTNGLIYEFTGKKILSFVIATIFASVINFTLQNRWVFK
jgi:putative flippase GtrA